MKKESPLSRRLAGLNELASLPFTDATRKEIHTSLAHSNNLVVAAGARLAIKHALTDAISEKYRDCFAPG